MTAESNRQKRVVMLVDNRRRDLPVAALIAHQLKHLKITCFLEPLEAYRGVLAAHRPHLIIFNHLTARHLELYSRQLAGMGVKTAVLLNEGILYDKETMRFNSGRHHSQAHVDYYYCWNEPHRQCLIEEKIGESAAVEVVGIPRFDFYQKPWSRVFEMPRPEGNSGRPRILVCTNFVCAKYQDLPKQDGDKFFAAWKDRIPLYSKYWTSIRSQHRSRKRFFEFLDHLVAANEFHISLRPHPNEAQELYHEWYDRLTTDTRQHVTLDVTTNIATQILACDLEISCETCTTAIEAWLAGKPTIELTFEKNPLWYREEQAIASVECSDPADIVSVVREQLSDFGPNHTHDRRVKHLKKWCHHLDGQSSRMLAETVAEALRDGGEPDWSRLTFGDHRRAWKLHFMRLLGLPYHYDPFLPLKRLVRPAKYAMKYLALSKSICPRDVAKMATRIESVAADTQINNE